MITPEKRNQVLKELAGVINRHSIENEVDMPDFVIAEFMMNSFEAHAKAIKQAAYWCGDCKPAEKYD